MNKREFKKFIMLLMVFVTMNYGVIFAAVELNITIPTIEESTIAPERDFYIIGDIVGTVEEGTKLTVQLFRLSDGVPVRRIYTDIKDHQAGLHINYDKLSYYGGDDRTPLLESLMPDLVYDGVDLATFQDQWRKAYYDDYNFTAVVHGGRYSQDINPFDEFGVPYEPLVQGAYRIVVTMEKDGLEVGRTEKVIDIDHTQEKTLFRFSPDEHVANVTADAAANNYRVYNDPYAGIWGPSDFITSLAGSDLFAEILPKWKFVDRIEYEEGRAHFYVYNISPTSASYNVEIGTIQLSNDIDNEARLVEYYYDIGEPSLPNGNIQSNFARFDLGDKLQVTRVDLPTTLSGDNVLIISDLNTMVSDLDVSDGVFIDDSQEFISINGVVTPIQNSSEDISYDTANSIFTINNKIEYVKYNVSYNDVNYTVDKPIGVTRTYSPGYDAYSLLEFKHDIDVANATIGDIITIEMEGYDTYNLPVAGSFETFYITVN